MDFDLDFDRSLLLLLERFLLRDLARARDFDLLDLELREDDLDLERLERELLLALLDLEEGDGEEGVFDCTLTIDLLKKEYRVNIFFY